MHRLPDCASVEVERLSEAVTALRDDGWRLVTATCIPRERGGRTVLYHFERAERLRHVRVEVPADGAVPSIAPAFPAAFLVENEMRELQGLAVTGLTVDYGGRLYRDEDQLEGFVHAERHERRPLAVVTRDGQEG